MADTGSWRARFDQLRDPTACRRRGERPLLCQLGRYNNSATPGSPAYASGMPYDPDQPAPSGRYMYQQNLLVYRSRQPHAAPHLLRPL